MTSTAPITPNSLAINTLTAPLKDDLAAGDIVTFSELAHKLNVNPSTIFRWSQKGFPDGAGGRVRLLSLRKGRTWLTSWGAYLRFMATLPTNASSDEVPLATVRTPIARERAERDAAGELKRRHGI